MANVCMLLGKSGTGKSTSIKNLKPEETIIFNTLKKRLPFKGSQTVYNVEKKNLFNVDSHTSLLNLLQNVNEKAIHCKNVIIDAMIYIMRKEYFQAACSSASRTCSCPAGGAPCSRWRWRSSGRSRCRRTSP